ncbi:MAG TPA: GH92 family glycosyl hydrolase [Acidimicrobiales bacterium]
MTRRGRSVCRSVVLCLLSTAALAGGGLVATSGGAAAAVSLVTDPAAYVNPMIGTALGDDDFPGADAPFGMVQWSPDTSPSRPEGGGYSDHDPLISGFSLTHISGPGCAAGGDIPILPTVGSISDPLHRPTPMPLEPYSHATESASPGSYAVDVGLPAVKTELTVTTRSGLARLTYPSTAQANVMIDLGGSEMPVTKASGTVVGNDQIEGTVTVGGPGNGFCGENDGYTINFWLEFNRPFESFGSWNGPGIDAGSRQASGTRSGLYATFDTSASDPTVLVKAGISYVSQSNAQLNAITEDPGWNFDAVQAATYGSWNALLQRIEVGGGTPTDTTVFYTALYHSLLHPNVFSDVNGQYMGFDDQVHTLPPGHAQYANFSGWDIYRSQAQLVAMIDPSVGSDIATSMLNDDAQSGELPKWSLDNGESYVMVGDPADPILADLHAFGATFDTSQALSDMVQEAMVPGDIRPGLADYESMHYLPSEANFGCCNFYGPVSTTLEYETADEAIAQLASSVGDAADAYDFMTRAQNWEYSENPATGYIEPKNTAGEFPGLYVPDDPAGYVEGNGYEYSADVPFNLAALIAADGGDAKYIDYLNQLFVPFIGPKAPLGQAYDFAVGTAITIAYGLPFSWQGDEPSVEIPWEYDYAGAPYGTQEIVRKITESLFTNQPAGIPGNDDLGEMSSWLVWADLGFYPETPGSADLALGSPLFKEEVVNVASGHQIAVSAPNASDETPYVQAMTVNGQPWNQAWLPSSLVAQGGQITVGLGSVANTSWASSSSAAPPSWGLGELPAIADLSSTALPALPVSQSETLGVRNVTGSAQRISWVAHPGAGLHLSVTSGSVVVPAEGSVSVPLSISASSASVTSTVTFDLTDGSGAALPPVILTVEPAGNLVQGDISGLNLGQAIANP